MQIKLDERLAVVNLFTTVVRFGTLIATWKEAGILIWDILKSKSGLLIWSGGSVIQGQPDQFGYNTYENPIRAYNQYATKLAKDMNFNFQPHN